MAIIRWMIIVSFALAAIAVIASPPKDRQRPKAYISNLFEESEEPRDMAIIPWISTSGDGSQTASWEGGVKPNAATDIALLDGRSQVSWTSGMTGHGSAIVYATSDYRGNIGSSGAYLTLAGPFSGVDVMQGVFNHQGRLFVDLQRSGGGSADVSFMTIGMPRSGVDNAHIDGNFGDLIIKGGGVTLDASMLCNRLDVFAGSRVLIVAGSQPQATPSQWGGYVECNVNIQPIVYGGFWYQRKLMTGALHIRGGHMLYIPNPFAVGDMDLNLWTGSLDVRGNPADVFSSVTGEAVLIGPDFRLIGVTSIDTVGSIDYRKEFPAVGT